MPSSLEVGTITAGGVWLLVMMLTPLALYIAADAAEPVEPEWYRPPVIAQTKDGGG